MKFTFDKEEFQVKIWKNEDLGKYVTIDTETTVCPFHLTPDLVTIQAYGGGDCVYYVPKKKIKLFLNKHYDSKLIFMNCPFDGGVIEKELNDNKVMFDLYDRKRIQDIGILYRLWHLAAFGFVPFKSSLDHQAATLLKIEIEKNEEIRCNFAQFKDTDIEKIPADFLEYGAIDVIVTHRLYWYLRSRIKEHDKFNTLLSHDIQVKGDWALNKIYKNGIGFDLKGRDEWLKKVDADMLIYSDRLACWGWVRGTKGIKDRFKRILTQIGIADSLPKTEDGSISSKAEDLEPYRNLDFIDAYLGFQKLEKASSFVREITSSHIHPRYTTLVNTGRTSASKPNIQQLPRLGGIRELFVPVKKGNTFIITDYSAIELSTLAQVTYNRFGKSEMRNRINKGEDLHKFYASVMNKCEVKDVTKQMRQEAKAANFGYPGGLGTNTFIEFSRGYGLDLTQADAIKMKDAWHKAFPETVKYLSGEDGYVYTLTGRKRGNTSFCAEKNTPFQGLAADGLKLALYNLCKEGFIVRAEVHDEIVCEVKIEDAETLLPKMEKIMIESMKEVVPDVKIGVESMISETYTK